MTDYLAQSWEDCARHVEAGGVVEWLSPAGTWEEQAVSARTYRWFTGRYSDTRRLLPIPVTSWEQCAAHVEAGGVVEVQSTDGTWLPVGRVSTYRERLGSPTDPMWLPHRLVPIISAAPTPDESSTDTGEGQAQAATGEGHDSAGECSGSPATEVPDEHPCWPDGSPMLCGQSAWFEAAEYTEDPNDAGTWWDCSIDIIHPEEITVGWVTRDGDECCFEPSPDMLRRERPSSPATTRTADSSPREESDQSAVSEGVKEVGAKDGGAPASDMPTVPDGHEIVVLLRGVVDYWAARGPLLNGYNSAVRSGCQEAVARRPKPAPETERVPWWEAAGRIAFDGRRINEVRRHRNGTPTAVTNAPSPDEYPSIDPDGTVEVLVDGES